MCQKAYIHLVDHITFILETYEGFLPHNCLLSQKDADRWLNPLSYLAVCTHCGCACSRYNPVI